MISLQVSKNIMQEQDIDVTKEQEDNESTSVVVVEEETIVQNVGKYVGQCKWFNDLLGYGFVTVCDGNEKGKDIFVHHSGIMPLNSNYRTLRKGEYLNFNVVDGLNGLQAVDVTGINGGPLMCDFVSVARTSMPLTPSTPSSRPSRQSRPSQQGQQGTIKSTCESTPNNGLKTNHKLVNVSNPYQAISNALGSQWYVVTKTGRKKNLAKYSKEGRTLLKQAKQDVMDQMKKQ